MTSRPYGGRGQGFCDDSIINLISKKHYDGRRVVMTSFMDNP